MELLKPEHVEAVGVLPPWAINGIIWCTVAIVSVLMGSYGWFVRRYIVKIEANSKAIENLATKQSLQDAVDKMVSKTDFTAILLKIDIDANRRHQEQREDRQGMHLQNREDNKTLRTELATRDEGIRGDIRAVHGRVDDLMTALAKEK